MIDLEKVRQDLAMQHNMLIDKDDPALATLVMFDELLEQGLASLSEQQQANVKALLNSQQKSHEETRRLAKKVVDEGTEYACDQISTAITATMDECREQIREDVRLAWRKIELARKITMFSAAVSSVCALIAVLAMLNVA